MIGGGAVAAASVTSARSRTTIVPAARSPRRRVCGWKNITTRPISTTAKSMMRMTLRTATAAEVDGGAVDADHAQPHGALARGLAGGHRLGDEEVPEVHEAREEPDRRAGEVRPLAGGDEDVPPPPQRAAPRRT